MKNLTPFVMLAAFAAMTFASCKKDWTCECSVNGEVYSTSTIKAKKKDAEAACSSSGSTFGVTYECKIKK